MPAVQLALEFRRPALVAAALWKDRALPEPEPARSPSWVLPAPLLAEGDVAALHRETRSDWRQHARCACAEDPDAWFPDPATPEEGTAAARAQCARCPVRRSCLAQALLGDEYGLWGGLTRRQRRSALDQLDPENPDWAGLLDGLLLRLTPASVPVAGRSAA